MRQEENAFRWAYWWGDVDARPLALFRIGFAVVLFQDLLDLTENVRAFYTDEGMLPRGVWSAPYAFSLYHLVGTATGAWLLFGLTAIALLSFLVGYKTRLSTALCWLLFTCLHNRNPFVIDGGDDLVRTFLFFGAFADLGACWSVDAALHPERTRVARAFGLRLLQWELALFYFVCARLKWRLGWRTENAIYADLQLLGFVRPLGGVLAQYPVLCRALSWLVMSMEFMLPFFALSPVKPKLSRALAIACGVMVQGGIWWTLRVGVFTGMMIWVNTVYLQPEWLDWIGVRWRRLRDVVPTTLASASDVPPVGGSRRPGRLWVVLYGFAGLQLLLVHYGAFAGRRFPLPAALYEEVRYAGIVQPYDLFGTIYDVPEWHAEGTLSTGQRVDVLALARPELGPREPGFHFSRWYKFTFKGRDWPLHYETLGPYLCRRFAEVQPESSLEQFDLYSMVRKPQRPGEPMPPWQRVDLWHQSCEGTKSASGG